MNNHYQVAIIGCGPAGIYASIAFKKAGVDFIIFEKEMIGGKVNIAPRVDNYPGFDKVFGPDLAMAFYQRLKDNNIDVELSNVTSLTKKDNLFYIESEIGNTTADYVLIACGTKERKLGFENEDRLLGKGLSYCALCDGHFFKKQVVALIGGGNVALKDAIYLSKLCSKIYLIHRRNEFKGDEYLISDVKKLENVEILTPYIPLEILDDGKVNGVKIQNVDTKEIKTLSINGIFPLIGQIPNTSFIKIDGVLDIKGTIPHDENMKSNIDGLYVAGDVTPKDERQIYIAEDNAKIASDSIIKLVKK